MTDPARRLRHATRHLLLAHGTLDDLRRPCGTPLPMPHAWALIELLHDGPMTVSALAERLRIDRTNVSRLCSRMEAQGELVREVHPDDARARLLRLTDAGRQAARSVDAASAAHFARLAEALGPDHDRVLDALHRLAEAMRTFSTPEHPP